MRVAPQLALEDKPKAAAALAIATKHHAGVKRKWTDEPYINHPIRVAETLLRYGWNSESTIAAAVLHDCLEDPDHNGKFLDRQVILGQCGPEIISMVESLTAPARHVGNRAARKKIYNAQLGRAHATVLAIKCADIIDNVTGIVGFDPSFADLYLTEKTAQIDVLKRVANPGFVSGQCIYSTAKSVIMNEQHKLGLYLIETHAAKAAKVAADAVALDNLAAYLTGNAFSDHAMF